MNRLHLTAIATIVAGAVALGGVSISSHGGSASPATGATQSAGLQTVAERTAALDALEASLDRQLAAAESPVANPQPTGQQDTRGSSADDGGDDHGGWDRDDDNGSDDD